jgi:hypothetical protein
MFQHLLFTLLILIVFQGRPGVAAYDALDEVNRTRAAQGLRPFIRDEALSQAAAACADHRAQYRIAGHTRSDFGFLPPGAQASAAGCAAWGAESGWGACCTYENWQYAGAAFAYGADGRRYMHLFVNNAPNAVPQAVVQQQQQQRATTEFHWTRMDTGWAYWKGNKQMGFSRDDKVFFWLRDDGTWSAGQPQK